MKRKFIAILIAFALVATLAACGGGEETTLSGMVVALESTTLSLVEMDMENMRFSQGERPEMPEGETFPQWSGGEMPDGMSPPEGMTMPEGGEMPNFGGMQPGSGNFSMDMETKDVDIANAHISVEIDGGKASGSLEDLVPGAFVTITLNSKGEATYVLVSSQAFSGGSRPG